MTPIIDNWVLIVDSNNYTVARFFGEKTDKNGKTYNDIRDAKYYTSLSGAFRGLRGQRKESGDFKEGNQDERM